MVWSHCSGTCNLAPKEAIFGINGRGGWIQSKGHSAIMFRKWGTAWGQSTKIGCHISGKFANCWFL